MRYSIPGAVTLFLTIAFVSLGRVMQGASWEGITSALGGVSSIVAIVATIPLGFVIYQLYYMTYRHYVMLWPLLWTRRRHWVRVDRGALVLSSMKREQLDRIEEAFNTELKIDEVWQPADWPLARWFDTYELKPDFLARGNEPYERYRERWTTNRNVLRALLDVTEATDAGRGIKAEYTMLSDLYHAHGACRAGVQLAWFTSSLVLLLGFVIAGGSWWKLLCALLVSGTLTAALGSVFHFARRDTWGSAQGVVTLGLAGLFKRCPHFLG